MLFYSTLLHIIRSSTRRRLSSRASGIISLVNCCSSSTSLSIASSPPVAHLLEEQLVLRRAIAVPRKPPVSSRAAHHHSLTVGRVCPEFIPSTRLKLLPHSTALRPNFSTTSTTWPPTLLNPALPRRNCLQVWPEFSIPPKTTETRPITRAPMPPANVRLPCGEEVVEENSTRPRRRSPSKLLSHATCIVCLTTSDLCFLLQTPPPLRIMPSTSLAPVPLAITTPLVTRLPHPCLRICCRILSCPPSPAT